MGAEYTKQGTCSINLFSKYILFPTDFTGSKINNPGTSSVMLSSPEWVARMACLYGLEDASKQSVAKMRWRRRREPGVQMGLSLSWFMEG